MINFINSIASERIVLVGIKGEGSLNLNAGAYTAL